MQRAQRGIDNPALDTAVAIGNELQKPVVVFFAPVPFYPHANLRHYRFLADAIPDIAKDLAARKVGFALRTYPEHSLLRFCEETRPALVVGDEDLLRETEEWRIRVTKQIRVPFWTVDADVIVPSRLLEKEQFAARTIRPRLQKLLPKFLVPLMNPKARVAWTKPKHLRSLSVGEDFISAWTLD